jgi:hypothetical protein
MRPNPARRQFLTSAAAATALSSDELARLRAPAPGGWGGDRACVLLFLFGGPSQIDLWDMNGAPPSGPGLDRPEGGERSVLVQHVGRAEPGLAEQIELEGERPG